ncbi:hypothetical protein [Nocardioides ferulae]|uniref:hypothetical protein n=1 Tax=Nocardioides ferulae TaxID=2340821 RepID=UPI00197EE817|nr:hypothetical protein [Nocardioides ferulae]
MRVLPKRERPPIEVRRGERVLAWARATDGAVAGTREALYLASDGGDADRIPWEQVQAADWDRDSAELRVSEVGTWGAPRPEHLLSIEEPGRLLELLRERVTTTVLLQRHVPIHGRRGVRVVARRAPTGAREVTWVYEFDEGVDPDDPEVRDAAEAALAQAVRDVGID